MEQNPPPAGGDPPPNDKTAPAKPPAQAGLYPFLTPPDRPGDLGRLGRYRAVELLGEGGMGYVFRAEDDGLRRPVALKVMKPAVAALPTARERFLREGRAAAAIKSDHVITIYEVGEEAGVVFLAMEFLAGQNLDDWLAARPTPAPLASGLEGSPARPAGAGGGPRQGPDPPGHQAGQPVGRVGHEPDQDPRLRADPGCRSRYRTDGHRQRDGHSRIHGPGTGAWESGRCPRGPVQHRRSAVPDGRGEESVRVRHRIRPSAPSRLARDRHPRRPRPSHRSTTCQVGRPATAGCECRASGARRGRATTAARAVGPVDRVPAEARAASREAGAGGTGPGRVERVGRPGSGRRGGYEARSPTEVRSGVARRGHGDGRGVGGRRRVPDLAEGDTTNGTGRDAAGATTKGWQVLPTGPAAGEVQPKAGETPRDPPPSPKTVTPPTPPTHGLLAGEVSEPFEYVIDGVKQHGTRRVLSVNIGNGVTMEFVRIDPGTFRMGRSDGDTQVSWDEKEPREVELRPGFYLGKFEVTQAQYKAVAGPGKNPSKFQGDTRPVETVSWTDAERFCTTLSGRIGRKAVLPSEAQWEYACRAGTRTPYHFGAVWDATLVSSNGESTAGVGAHAANPWWLHDMLGNVSEWCQDYYGPYDAVKAKLNPVQLIKQSNYCRIGRGGSWSDGAWRSRTSTRRHGAPASAVDIVGFRVCLPLD